MVTVLYRLIFCLAFLLAPIIASADNALVNYIAHPDMVDELRARNLFAENGTSALFFPVERENVFELDPETPFESTSQGNGFADALEKALSRIRPGANDHLAIRISSHGNQRAISGPKGCGIPLKNIAETVVGAIRKAASFGKNPIVTFMLDACHSAAVFDEFKAELAKAESKGIRLNIISASSVGETTSMETMTEDLQKLSKYIEDGNIERPMSEADKLRLIHELTGQANIWSSYIPESDLVSSADEMLARYLRLLRAYEPDSLKISRTETRPGLPSNLRFLRGGANRYSGARFPSKIEAAILAKFFSQLESEGRTLTSDAFRSLAKEFTVDKLIQFLNVADDFFAKGIAPNAKEFLEIAKEFHGSANSLVRKMEQYVDMANLAEEIRRTPVDSLAEPLERLQKIIENSNYPVKAKRDLLSNLFFETEDIARRSAIGRVSFAKGVNFADGKLLQIWQEIFTNPKLYGEELIEFGLEQLLNSKGEKRIYLVVENALEHNKQAQRLIFALYDKLFYNTGRYPIQAMVNFLELAVENPEWVQESEYFAYLRDHGRKMDRLFPWARLEQWFVEQLAETTDVEKAQRLFGMAEIARVRDLPSWKGKFRPCVQRFGDFR